MSQQPLTEEIEALAACAPEFHTLGDCTGPKKIFAATNVAYAVARNLGRV